MKLVTDRLRIRDYKQGDEESLRKNINNLSISKYLLVISYPYKKKDTDWWINHCLEEQKKEPRKSYDLAITIKPNDNIVGGIGLSSVNRFQKTATLGYWLGEDYWRNGYMYEAAQRILKFAFNRLKLRRIDIEAYTDNKPSNKLIKKLGGKYEGTKRQGNRVKATGKVVDANIYGILREDWKK